jgi:twitching motility protein PilT
MVFESLLAECITKNASDIHIKEGEPIMLRIEGVLVRSDIDVLPDKIVMFDFLYSFLHARKEKISYFKHNMDIDFGYQDKIGNSFRGNAYMYREKMAIAIRRIPDKIKNLVEL